MIQLSVVVADEPYPYCGVLESITVLQLHSKYRGAAASTMATRHHPDDTPRRPGFCQS